jgi:hypothetical protein
VVITEIGRDGSLRRRALDTSRLTDPGRWEDLIGQVLAVPPPYRATPRRPVYVLQASGAAVVMGEDNLIGSLRQLVTTILAAGDPCLTHRPGDGHRWSRRGMAKVWQSIPEALRSTSLPASPEAS